MAPRYQYQQPPSANSMAWRQQYQRKACNGGSNRHGSMAWRQSASGIQLVAWRYVGDICFTCLHALRYHCIIIET